jgi:hypothetical protein
VEAGQTAGARQGGRLSVPDGVHAWPTIARGTQAKPPSPVLQYELASHGPIAPHAPGSSQVPSGYPTHDVPAAHTWYSPEAVLQD